jgi:hypothetical protein
MIDAARDRLLGACGLPPGSAGWARFRTEAAALAGQVNHPQLTPLLHRAAESSDAVALESVLAYVAGRPPRTWNDADVTRFGDQAAAIGKRYRTERQARLPDADLSPAQQARSRDMAAAIVAYLATHFDDDPAVVNAALRLLLQAEAPADSSPAQTEERPQ